MGIPVQFKDKLRLPVIGAPMFIASSRDLVVAQCKAGVIGSFPALNARPQSELADWIAEIRERLAAAEAEGGDTPVAPFAVNQVMSPLNDRWQADLATIVREQVPLIITSLRAPPAEIIQEVHGYQGLVFHDVTNLRHARKAAQAGVDGLILVAAGAGGQGGDRSPFALVNQVREFFDGTILLSGAMSTGSDVLAAQAMGADMAYIGSPFIATHEANADEAYKAGIVAGRASDIVYSNLFTGVHGNYLRSSIEAAGLDPDNLPESDPSKMSFGSGGNQKAKAWKDIWGCGQGIGAIKEIPSAGEMIDRLAAEYEAAKAALAAKTSLTRGSALAMAAE